MIKWRLQRKSRRSSGLPPVEIPGGRVFAEVVVGATPVACLLFAKTCGFIRIHSEGFSPVQFKSVGGCYRMGLLLLWMFGLICLFALGDDWLVSLSLDGCWKCCGPIPSSCSVGLAQSEEHK